MIPHGVPSNSIKKLEGGGDLKQILKKEPAAILFSSRDNVCRSRSSRETQFVTVSLNVGIIGSCKHEVFHAKKPPPGTLDSGAPCGDALGSIESLGSTIERDGGEGRIKSFRKCRQLKHPLVFSLRDKRRTTRQAVDLRVIELQRSAVLSPF